MNISTLPRRQKEQLVGALVEKSRRNQTRRVSGATQPALDLLTWTILNRRLLAPGQPFDLVQHPYLVEIYQCMARRKVFKKSSQMGLSEYGISYTLHAAGERDMTVMYIFPTDGLVSKFSASRFGPALEASPYLTSMIVDGSGDRRGVDQVMLKRFGNHFIHFVGGQVKPNGQAPQLKQVPADGLVYDELDETDPRVPAIAEKRLGHSEVREEMFISTPTYPGFGIDAVWQESDQREWFVPCPHCRKWQPMNKAGVILEYDDLERPTRWHGQGDGGTSGNERAFAACRKCGKELNRLAQGRWVAAYPGREMAGFHVTKLFSPRVDLLGMVQGLQTVDETKRREAENQDWGETYTPRGGQLTTTTLDGLRRDYGFGPVSGEQTMMGIDVGKVQNVIIRGDRDGNGERPLRFAGEVEGGGRLIDLVNQYKVRRVVIDALPETTKAREFQAAVPRGVEVWLSYYVGQQVGSKGKDPAAWDVPRGNVNLDRTRTLDETFSRFYEGINTLPGFAKDIPHYYDQLTAPIRVLEDGPNGTKVAKYIESEADHYAHAENYCTVATMNPPIKRAGVWGRNQ